MSTSNALGAYWAWLHLHLPHWPHDCGHQSGRQLGACLLLNKSYKNNQATTRTTRGGSGEGRGGECSKRCPDCGRQALSQRFKLRVCVCIVGCHVCAAVCQCWWFLRLPLLPELGVVAAWEVRLPACDSYLLPVTCYLFLFPDSSAWTCVGSL